MKVVVVHKSDPALFPPVITTCQHLAACGCSVTLICVAPSSGMRADLESLGIKVVNIGGVVEVHAPAATRVWRFLCFSFSAWNVIQQHLRPGTLLWVGSVETAVALGPRLQRHAYVLHMHELYDREVRYRVFLPRLVGSALAVVTPEENRAALIRYWYHPRHSPFVIPNKPFESSAPDAASACHPLSCAPGRTLLYQGLIDLRERDLLPLARAVAAGGGRWRLALLGHDLDSVARIAEVCPAVVHLPFIPPPGHLVVTARADVGVVSYAWNSLNLLFCAPNKIWEYARFGKPMLCNDVPGLRDTVGRHGAGLCVDFRDEAGILAALDALAGDYSAYSERARQFYSSCDVGRLYSELLEKLEAELAKTPPSRVTEKA